MIFQQITRDIFGMSFVIEIKFEKSLSEVTNQSVTVKKVIFKKRSLLLDTKCLALQHNYRYARLYVYVMMLQSSPILRQ